MKNSTFEISVYTCRIRILRQIVLFFVLLMPFSLTGQQSNTLYTMHSIPQSNQLNPAVQLECKYFVGLPGLSNVHVNYSNTAFTYNSIAEGSRLRLDTVFSHLKRMNMVAAEVMVNPISLGYRMDDHYFTLSASERFFTYNSYPRKLAGLILYGNYPLYLGDNHRFSNLRANASYYREYSAGYSLRIDDYLTAGARAKLLFGKADITTGRSRVLLGTDADRFDLSIDGDVGLNASLPINIEQDNDSLISVINFQEIDFREILMNPGNVGLAFDVGVILQQNNYLKLSASLLDVGVIRYSTDVYNVGSKVEFFHDGASEETDFSTAAYYRDLTDSLINDIRYDVSRESYFAPMPMQLYVGAEYLWNRDVTLGLVNRTLLVNRRLKNSFTISLKSIFFENFRATASLSYLNNTVLNPGGGLAYVGRGLQLYLVSDNIYGLFNPLDSRTINFRFGMNLMLGCPPKAGRVEQTRKKMMMGKCGWVEPDKRFKKGFLKREIF
ncbi:MAG TPA: DUF5723 family protein [Bacteroidales bacterium]|nr:DUF5723 family protein [Bacteroidales bacterium]